jgi:glycine/D-amino acid oxidase-like deaminating enzyme
MPKRKDVVIVGAGVIGCSIAYHLGKRGISCHIVERESIGTRASGKAWAVVAYPPTMLVEERMHAMLGGGGTDGPIDLLAMPPGESVLDWYYVYTSSYERMPDLALELAERGGIDVEYGESYNTTLVSQQQLEAAGPDGLLRPIREAGGAECVWIDGEALREQFPGLCADYVGGFAVPEGQLEPYKFTLGLAQAAERMGAEFAQGEVVGFASEGDKITGVRLASGAVIEADAVVLAMGPWTAQGSAWLGCEVPCRNFLTQCLRVEVPGGLPLQTLVGGDYWIIPKVNGEVILAIYGTDFIERPDFDASLSEEIKLEILRGVTGILPALGDAKLLEHRGDLMAYPPKPPYHKPVMGRLPGWQNGYLATRFGGLGINMSPAAGELMAELIATGRPPLRAKRMLETLSPCA